MIRSIESSDPEGSGIVEVELVEDGRIWIDCHVQNDNLIFYVPVLLDVVKARRLVMILNSVIEQSLKNQNAFHSR